FCASFFFFQAEDGIRDFHVTGVQTCALPIFPLLPLDSSPGRRGQPEAQKSWRHAQTPARRRKERLPEKEGKETLDSIQGKTLKRSEERRVGKECRSGWSRWQ